MRDCHCVCSGQSESTGTHLLLRAIAAFEGLDQSGPLSNWDPGSVVADIDPPRLVVGDHTHTHDRTDWRPDHPLLATALDADHDQR